MKRGAFALSSFTRAGAHRAHLERRNPAAGSLNCVWAARSCASNSATSRVRWFDLAFAPEHTGKLALADRSPATSCVQPSTGARHHRFVRCRFGAHGHGVGQRVGDVNAGHERRQIGAGVQLARQCRPAAVSRRPSLWCRSRTASDRALVQVLDFTA